MLFNKERVLFSVVYLLTLLGTINFAVFSKRYVFVLLFSLGQVRMLPLPSCFPSSASSPPPFPAVRPG